MNDNLLIFSSISRYKSFYRLIAIAVVVAVAVIVGSLAVGDSVRGSLMKRVEERLGKTETIIFSRYSYLDEKIVRTLSESQRQHTMPIRGALISNGFVSVSGKLIPVSVWGVDDLQIEKGSTKINHALSKEIKSSQAENIVLRLPAAGMVPSGSLFVTDTYTTSLRLELESVVSEKEGGNINLKNEQTIPFNIFVHREELAEALDVSGKINVILSEKIISKEEFAAVWNFEYSGLHIDSNGHCELDSQSPSTLTSDRIFIQNEVVNRLCPSNRIFNYLANSIRIKGKFIPYSFISAVDHYEGLALQPDEIILSDYAAKRLNVNLNDTLSVSYFISRQLKTLLIDSVFLKVGKIIPLKDLQNNKTIIADFPGLSNVDRCTDWNSDLPIQMNLITNEDEAYWTQYRNTPKALVPYSVMADRWENPFGSATALEITDINKLKELTFEMFDIQLISPRNAAILAAQSGVDFSSLFLSLGFFIIISAALLMLVPLGEMLFKRRGEISLLRAIGFSKKRIVKLIWKEALLVVFSSAFTGVIAGLIYTLLVLFMLGNIWKGATHTDGFSAYPNWITIAGGMMLGVTFSVMLSYFRIVYELRSSQSRFLTAKRAKKSQRSQRKLIWASLYYTRKQGMLSFITLTLGVFIVFWVGLNRRGFADSLQIRAATGGYSLWCETAVPVYYNIQTEEGRTQLGLKDLFNVEALYTMPLLKYTADDASCLNLNKVVTPNVLGIDMDELQNSEFVIMNTIFDDAIFEQLKKNNNSLCPALIDETVLTWSLGKKIGDTLIYAGEKGDSKAILLAGTIRNSIFQGYILIDKNLFAQMWSEISGSEIMLISVPDSVMADTKAIITQALNPYGVRVMTTAERLQMFYSVTDTYLTIFLTLGSLGLLIGVFSFIIVVRKNMLARVQEISLYCALGFNDKKIQSLLYKENVIIPLTALITGILCAFLAVSYRLENISIGVWAMAIAFFGILVLSIMIFVKYTVKLVVSEESFCFHRCFAP